jgi:hypothetical protein
MGKLSLDLFSHRFPSLGLHLSRGRKCLHPAGGFDSTVNNLTSGTGTVYTHLIKNIWKRLSNLSGMRCFEFLAPQWPTPRNRPIWETSFDSHKEPWERFHILFSKTDVKRCLHSTYFFPSSQETGQTDWQLLMVSYAQEQLIRCKLWHASIEKFSTQKHRVHIYFCFWDRVSLCSSGCPPRCWNYRSVPSCHV